MQHHQRYAVILHLQPKLACTRMLGIHQARATCTVAINCYNYLNLLIWMDQVILVIIKITRVEGVLADGAGAEDSPFFTPSPTVGI